MLESIDPKSTAAWKALAGHYDGIKDAPVRDMFKEDPLRFNDLSIRFEDILFDYSKNIINKRTMDLLLGLARETKVSEGIEKMFSGEKINATEDRAVLHTALRNMSGEPVYADGKDVMPDVRRVMDKIMTLSKALETGRYKGCTGKKITDIVNIGIGSDLLICGEN